MNRCNCFFLTVTFAACGIASAGFEIADLTEAMEDQFRGYTKVWLDYGENPITPEEWETYVPSAGYLKNTPRNPEFNAENTFSSPGVPAGDVIVESIDGYTWKFIAQTQSAMRPYNHTLFPGTLNAYQAAFATTTPPAGTVKFSSNEKNQEMVFWAREGDQPDGAPILRFFITDEWGNRYILGATGVATDAEIPASFASSVLPDGWTKQTGYLDATISLLPAYGAGDQAHFNLFRESADNTFFQIEWSTSGEGIATQISGMPIWGGATNDRLIGRSGDDNLVHGAEGDDTITALGENDTIHGDAGTDTVVLPGARSEYRVSTWSLETVVLEGGGFMKTLHDVEFVQFTDATVATATLDRPSIKLQRSRRARETRKSHLWLRGRSNAGFVETKLRGKVRRHDAAGGRWRLKVPSLELGRNVIRVRAKNGMEDDSTWRKIVIFRRG